MNKEEAMGIVIGSSVALRDYFRKHKKFEPADIIREALAVLGYKVEDEKVETK